MAACGGEARVGGDGCILSVVSATAKYRKHCGAHLAMLQETVTGPINIPYHAASLIGVTGSFPRHPTPAEHAPSARLTARNLRPDNTHRHGGLSSRQPHRQLTPEHGSSPSQPPCRCRSRPATPLVAPWPDVPA